MKKQPPTSLFRFLTELVKHPKELCQRATRQISASHEMAGAASRQHARPKDDSTPPDGVINAEEAVAKAGVKLDDLPPVIPPSQAPPEEQAENAVGPAMPGAGSELKNRFDAARSGVQNHAQSAEELQALLDQAITLLESVSRHPAIRDAADMQRRLEQIESRLALSANVQ
jgi:hypothetical protein